MKPTQLVFEEKYSDLSGVEFAVRFKDTTDSEPIIEIESQATKVVFPRQRLKWVLDCLNEIRKATS